MALPSAAPDLTSGNVPGQGPLRIDGRSMSDAPASGDNLPSTRSAASQSQMPALGLLRDLGAGPERVRLRGTTYLPKAPAEYWEDYNDRLARTPFFNVVARTLTGLVGQVFRKDPVLGDDVPRVIVDHLENVDLEGTHFDVFTRAVLHDAMEAGHAAILVDFPQTDGAQTAADEQVEIRPYWVHLTKEQILSWRTTTDTGARVLTQLVLRESSTVPSGRFGEAKREQYRVLTNTNGVVGWQLLEVTDDRRVVLVREGTYPTQTAIPVVEVATSGRIGLFVSRPPLLDLAYLNVTHYQVFSDYLTSIHKTCVPIFFGAGLEQATDQNGQRLPIVLGPNSAITSSDANAKASYVAHDGRALNEVRSAIDGLKSDMASLGLQMLSPQKRAAETLGAKLLDKSTEDSALAVTARALQDALEEALDIHAAYLGLPEGGQVTINREFDDQAMSSDLLTAYVGAVANAGLPPRILLEKMLRAGELPSDASVEDIVVEMEANSHANQDHAAQAAQDAAALHQPPMPPMPTGMA